MTAEETNKSSSLRGIVLIVLEIGLIFIILSLICLIAVLAFGKTSSNQNTQSNVPIVADNSRSSSGCEFPNPIPGLNYEKVTTHLRKMDLSCTPMTSDQKSYSANCSWTSSNGLTNINVDIFSGDRPEDIYLILASVFQFSSNPSDEYSSKILGYVAALPYDNAEPFKAKGWVSRELPKLTASSPVSDEPVREIGGVRFHIPCHETNLRCLAIGEGSGSGWEYECP